VPFPVILVARVFVLGKVEFEAADSLLISARASYVNLKTNMPNSKKEIEKQINHLNAIMADLREAKEETNRIIEPDRIETLDDAMLSVQSAIKETRRKSK